MIGSVRVLIKLGDQQKPSKNDNLRQNLHIKNEDGTRKIKEAVLVCSVGRIRERESEKKKNDLVVPQLCFLFIIHSTLLTIYVFDVTFYKESN